MSHRTGNDQVEFILLNGTAIRVTSWTESDDGQSRLVAIVRGSGEARALADLLATGHVELEVPGREPRSVTVAALDRRETGTAPAVITRFAIDFAPATGMVAAPTPRTIDERVTDLEQEVAALRALIQSIANDR